MGGAGRSALDPLPGRAARGGLSLEHLLLVRTRSEKESLWACEQALRNGRGGAVLAWPEHIGFARLRRLQLAAQDSAKLAFLFRPDSALENPRRPHCACSCRTVATGEPGSTSSSAAAAIRPAPCGYLSQLMRTPAIKLPIMNRPSPTHPEPCWLAIRFPHLALDLHTRGQSDRQTAVAVSALVDRRERIIDCNPAAMTGGVSPGMPVTAARAILDELHIVERNPAAEQEALQRLAAWCYQYSSQVCIPGDRAGLLLEAGASERLFGPPENLAKRLQQELGQLGYHAMAGSAPMPEAAWLAAGEGMHIDSQAQIRRELGPLPLDRLHLDAASEPAMQRMGFRQLRDLLRLPRKALTRRFGPALPDYLDRLLGVYPDPRKLYRPPESFSSRLELPAEIHTCQALLFPLKRMLEELCGVLRGGDSAVQSVQVTLGHEDHDDSLLELGLQSPTQDTDRLLTVLRERLERLRLPQAVREIRLEAPKLLKFSAGQRSLFHDTPAEQKQDIEQLAERLQARLGSTR